MENAGADPSLVVWPWVSHLSSLGFTWLLWAEGKWTQLVSIQRLNCASEQLSCWRTGFGKVGGTSETY